jgi:hypothetical protein
MRHFGEILIGSYSERGLGGGWRMRRARGVSHRLSHSFAHRFTHGFTRGFADRLTRDLAGHFARQFTRLFPRHFAGNLAGGAAWRHLAHVRFAEWRFPQWWLAQFTRGLACHLTRPRYARHRCVCGGRLRRIARELSGKARQRIECTPLAWNRRGLGLLRPRGIGIIERRWRHAPGRPLLGMRGLRLQWPIASFAERNLAWQGVGSSWLAPWSFAYGGGAHDILLDHDVRRAANDQQMLDVVAADQHQPAPTVDRGRVNDGQPGLSPACGCDAEIRSAEAPYEPCEYSEQAQHHDEGEHESQAILPIAEYEIHLLLPAPKGG